MRAGKELRYLLGHHLASTKPISRGLDQYFEREDGPSYEQGAVSVHGSPCTVGQLKSLEKASPELNPISTSLP